jgi:hypothetical protein
VDGAWPYPRAAVGMRSGVAVGALVIAEAMTILQLADRDVALATIRLEKKVPRIDPSLVIPI